MSNTSSNPATSSHEKDHPFERAGLGRAPFRWVGVSIKRGPIVISSSGGAEHTVGAPGQPMGSCAYCGQAIAECHEIRSSDGKRFEVGCVCVYKTDDRALISRTRDESKRAQKRDRKAREAARVEAAFALLDAREDVRSALDLEAHPRGGRGSALSYVEFLGRAILC